MHSDHRITHHYIKRSQRYALTTRGSELSTRPVSEGREGEGSRRGMGVCGGEGDKGGISFVWVIGYCRHCIATLVLHYDEDFFQVLYVCLCLFINFMIRFR